MGFEQEYVVVVDLRADAPTWKRTTMASQVQGTFDARNVAE